MAGDFYSVLFAEAQGNYKRPRPPHDGGEILAKNSSLESF